jgi:hypothetical protein
MNGGDEMNEFLALAALVVVVTTTAGALITAVAHYAVAAPEDGAYRRSRRPAQGTRAE